MATWGIHLFGIGRIWRSDVGAIAMPDVWWPLIGCLLASPGRRTSRARLATQIWPDKDENSARHCLATAFWRIKQRWPGGDGPVQLAGERIALTVDRKVWIDALAFERRAGAVVARPALLADPTERRRLAGALSLYRSSFLCEHDQEWIALERERLRTLYLDGMYELAMATAGVGDWSGARHAAQALCAVEPLREDAQRLLIKATARCGNRALAMNHFRTYALLLEQELGIAPMPETIALIAEVAGYRAPTPSPPPSPPPPSSPGPDYRGALLQTRDELSQTLHMVESSLAQ